MPDEDDDGESAPVEQKTEALNIRKSPSSKGQPRQEIPAARTTPQRPDNNTASRQVGTENNPVRQLGTQDTASRRAAPPSDTAARRVAPPSETASRRVAPPSDTASRRVAPPSDTASRRVAPPQDTSSRRVGPAQNTASRKVGTENNPVRQLTIPPLEGPKDTSSRRVAPPANGPTTPKPREVAKARALRDTVQPPPDLDDEESIPTQMPGAPSRSVKVKPVAEDIALENQPPVQVRTQPELAKAIATTSTHVGRRETMTPETPGRYELKREFGRGGQSSVWLALDRHIGRDVAFKQLLPQNSDPRVTSSQVVSSMGVRFLREARITGQLEHPSIVPVYEVGRRPDGSFYYTQKLVRGRTFTDALKLRKTVSERLGMLGHFIDLCQAIAYAHKRGVIHRDIKPDNVMVGEFGETVVLDWGLAKQLNAPEIEDSEEEIAKTQEGDIMGTPAYMSPEQAQGRKREIDGQSDVWSLGAVLYEILTGRAPFVGRNLMTMLIAVTKDPIDEPKTIERGVPPELAAIAMKALTRNRTERYQTAQEIIRDVEAWRTGLRVQVYRYTPWGTAARWLKKNRAIAITALCVMLALGIGSVRVALENRVARRNLAQALLEKADAASRELQWGKAAVYSAAAREEDDTAEARFRAAHKGPLEIDPLLRMQLPGPVDRVALSPDGQLAAVAITGFGLHLVGPNGQDLKQLELPADAAPVSYLTFSNDGALLAVASGNNTVLFNAQSGDVAATLAGTGPVEQVAFSFDNTKLVAAEGKSARVYDVASGKLLSQLDGHTAQVRAVAFAPDQSGVASSGDDGTIRFWPLPQGAAGEGAAKMVRGTGHSGVTRLAFSPTGRVIISASVDGTIRFHDLESSSQAHVVTDQGPLIDLAVAPQGLIASLGQDNSVVLLDAFSQAQVAKLEGDDATTAVAISADGSRLISANRDGKLRLWSVTQGARVYGFDPAPGFGSALSLAFSPSGKQVAAGDNTGHIQVWESANGKKTSAVSLPAGPVSSLAWSPAGATLAAAGPDEVISLFDIATSERTKLEGHVGPVFALAFSPDGKTLASVGQDGQIHLWDPAGAAPRGTISVSPAPLRTVVFSRDGMLLGAAGDDKTVHIFDAKTRKPLGKIEPSPDTILSIAFSPQNRIVAAAGRDQAVRTFRVSNGKLRSVWNGHGARIYSIAFAPDGEILASSSADGSLRLWDVLTGRQVVRFDRSPEPRALAFSPDGKLLASTGDHPAVQMIELDDKKALLKPAAELKRQLALHKLRFDGILLVDDLQALPGKAWKPVPTVSPDDSSPGD